MLVAALAVTALTSTACGQRIDYNEAAVEIKEWGSGAGVQDTEIGTGRYWRPPFSGYYIVKFPKPLQTYKFDGADGSQPCFHFINKDKVEVTACLALTAVIQADKASNIVGKYQGAISKGGGSDGYVLDDIIDGPVAREIQQELNYTGINYTTEQLYNDGGRALLDQVSVKVKTMFNPDGIMLQQLMWAKPPRLPDDIVGSIKGALKAQTDATRANAELAKTVAEGNKRRADADANAYVLQTEARAIAANPEILAKLEIERSTGICPRNAAVCVVGADAPAVLNALGTRRKQED
jgi:hypothetical protein